METMEAAGPFLTADMADVLGWVTCPWCSQSWPTSPTLSEPTVP